MKTKYLVLIGLLLALAVVLSGCATGLTASGWPGMTADANNAYIAGGPYVYAVNLQTGAQVWRFPDKASANPFDATPVLTSDGQLIVGGYDKKLYSLNPQTGQSTWQFTDARDRWIGGVLVVNNMIYAPNADYNLYALNLHGELQWTFAGRPVHLGSTRLGWDEYLLRHAWPESVRGKCPDRQTSLGAESGWGSARFACAWNRQDALCWVVWRDSLRHEYCQWLDSLFIQGFLLDLVRSGAGWQHPLLWRWKRFPVCSSRERHRPALEPAIERCDYRHTACQR